MKQRNPDYCIDAPGIRTGMLIAGTIGLVIAFIAGGARRWHIFGEGILWSVAPWLFVVGSVVAGYGLFMGEYMTYASKIGKLKTHQRLLDLVGD